MPLVDFHYNNMKEKSYGKNKNDDLQIYSLKKDIVLTPKEKSYRALSVFNKNWAKTSTGRKISLSKNPLI